MRTFLFKKPWRLGVAWIVASKRLDERVAVLEGRLTGLFRVLRLETLKDAEWKIKGGFEGMNGCKCSRSAGGHNGAQIKRTNWTIRRGPARSAWLNVFVRGSRIPPSFGGRITAER